MGRYVDTYGDKGGERVGRLVLRPKEYLFPTDVMRALLYASGGPWVDGHSPIAGEYAGSISRIANNPFKDKIKARFYKGLTEHGYEEAQIDEFWDRQCQTNAIFVYEEGRGAEKTLFHERMHNVMSEELTIPEQETLASAVLEFRDRMKSVSSSDLEPLWGSSGESFWDKYIPGVLRFQLRSSWQEFYTYTGQAQEYPSLVSGDSWVNPIVGKEFKQQHPDAYEVYQKVMRKAGGISW